MASSSSAISTPTPALAPSGGANTARLATGTHANTGSSVDKSKITKSSGDFPGASAGGKGPTSGSAVAVGSGGGLGSQSGSVAMGNGGTTGGSGGVTINPKDVVSPGELCGFVDNLLGQLESRFDDMSEQVLARMNEMSARIDGLETAISDLMHGGIEGGRSES